MFKRRMTILTAAALIGCMAFSACGESKETKESTKTEASADTEKKDEVTVTLYDSDGKTELGSPVHGNVKPLFQNDVLGHCVLSKNLFCIAVTKICAKIAIFWGLSSV